MSLLAITPIGDEFRALSNALTEQGFLGEERFMGRLSGLAFDGGRLLIARGGLGKAQFGIQAQHLLDHVENVRLIVCAGTAGRLVDTLSIGDVIVATITIEHDFNYINAANPRPTFEGEPAFLSTLRGMFPSSDVPFGVHFGPIASGDEGIGSASRARRIHQDTGALAVAWEGAGGARAARFSGIPFLEIRGISDGAADGAMDEFMQNIPVAMKNVAIVLHRLSSASG